MPRVLRRGRWSGAPARRRKAVRRRGPGRLALRKAIGSKWHTFKRTEFRSGAVAGSTLMDVAAALSFQLNNVPNFTEFTSLFDQYKINGIKVVFMPRANSAEVGTNQGIVKLFTAPDYDDAATPTLNEIMQYETLKTTRSTSDHSRYIRPRIARAVYQAGAVSAYSPGTAWIDCANPSVPHYGLKYVLQQLPAGNQTYDLKITYYLAFKNVI